MNLIQHKINLSPDQLNDSGHYQPILIPDGASKITIQLFHSFNNASGIAATVSLEQSTDGIHFDPCSDAVGNPIAITLLSNAQSATINLLGLLTLWIRISCQINENTTGSLSSCNLLFS